LLRFTRWAFLYRKVSQLGIIAGTIVISDRPAALARIYDTADLRLEY
jgi:hypothetical protein